jgi:hypothetical protein
MSGKACARERLSEILIINVVQRSHSRVAAMSLFVPQPSLVVSRPEAKTLVRPSQRADTEWSKLVGRNLEKCRKRRECLTVSADNSKTQQQLVVQISDDLAA